MYVMSIKLSKVKIIAAALAVTAAVCICAAAIGAAGNIDIQANGKPSQVTVAETPEQRSGFLKSFGWEVSPDPTQITEVLIPTEFDKTYEDYNIIQKKQGFDLTDYRGKRAKKWTYEVLNYPGNKKANATLLICDKRIIGGDISSAEQNGFMHGFEVEE